MNNKNILDYNIVNMNPFKLPKFIAEFVKQPRLDDLQSFKLPRLDDLINTVTSNVYDIKENFDSFPIMDIPLDIIDLHNPEGMSANWLTGWTVAKLILSDHINHLYFLYTNEDDGNFASGFNHYLYYKRSINEIIDLEWKLIRQIPSEDPYNFHQIHKHRIIYSDINYNSIDKITTQVLDFVDLFVVNNSPTSLLATIILCLLKIKDTGISLIKLPQLWDTEVINFVIYCCTVADCKLIILPWSGIYLELRNINVYIFDNNYKYLMDCLHKNKHIFPENVIKEHKEIIDIMKESRNWNIFSSDITCSDKWIDIKKIIPINNYQSVFSHIYN